MRLVHDFKDSLAASHHASDLPIWEEVYRKAFAPHFASMTDHRGNGFWQQAGIDRTVTLATTAVYRIDEKIRKEPWPDIALEFLSNDRTGAPGWVCKPLLADYVAYAVLPLGICYLLPVIQLQQAWLSNGEEWRGRFKICKAHNSSYSTHSVAVPVDVLFKAIGKALRISFTPPTTEQMGNLN